MPHLWWGQEYDNETKLILVLHNIQQLINGITNGETGLLARAITIVENELQGYNEVLKALPGTQQGKVIGITGAPGAGKSTLVDALLHAWLGVGKRVAILAVDPSSPFNYGAILGDRIRMADHFLNENIYIRSLASRGHLGGLNVKTVEITDILKNAPFDYVVVETVGVGQSEVDIAGLADLTIVVVVPEGGDEIQSIKAGIMEIADLYVVNKADRNGAEAMYRHIRTMTHERDTVERPVIMTVATEGIGIGELANVIERLLKEGGRNEKRSLLVVEKAWQLIARERMKDVNMTALIKDLEIEQIKGSFNIYRFVENYK